MIKVFFDTEFTGLHQATTLMSIGAVSEDGDSRFYAELTDYDQAQVNDWLRENVENNFILADWQPDTSRQFWNHIAGAMFTQAKGSAAYVADALKQWLAKEAVGEKVQMWSDCLAYDWVLLNGLLADYTNGYPQLPESVHYIPMDICTLFQLKGIDPDISREEFIASADTCDKHNALWDAQVIKACYDKLAA